MIKLLSQFTLVTIRFYQEKSQQIIEFVRENPTQTKSMFGTIRIDIHNINKVLEGLLESIELFDHSETADLYIYYQKLKSTVTTMEIFLSELEEIVRTGNIDSMHISNYDLSIEDTDGDAA
jgi:F0F1-type ATP synthase gamma subunit